MGRALVCNSAGKLNTGGGTFADTLAAVSPDSLSVANYDAAANVSRGRNKLDLIDCPSQARDIPGESLFKSNLAGEGNDRCLILVGAQNRFQKRSRGGLFFRQSTLFGSAGVDQNCQ